MANSAQARKRARQNVIHHHRNMSLRSELRTAIKHVRKSIATVDKTVAAAALKASTSTIDSIADKGIIHKIRLHAIKAAFPRLSRRWLERIVRIRKEARNAGLFCFWFRDRRDFYFFRVNAQPTRALLTRGFRPAWSVWSLRLGPNSVFSR